MPAFQAGSSQLPIHHILAPFVRITEDFVGLVDFPNLAFSLGFVFRNIGMKFAGQLAERLLDFRGGRISINTKDLILVLEIN